MVALASDQAAQVQHNTPGLVALPGKGGVGVLQSSELLLIPLALTLELLGDLLLQNQSLESVIALLLGARQADRETSIVILLLIDKTSQTAVLPLVILDLNLEILGLFGELLGERLELEELS